MILTPDKIAEIAKRVPAGHEWRVIEDGVTTRPLAEFIAQARSDVPNLCETAQHQAKQIVDKTQS